MIQSLQIIIMLLGSFGLGYAFKFYLNEKLISHLNSLKAEIDSLTTKLAWSESEKNKLQAVSDKTNTDCVYIALKNES